MREIRLATEWDRLLTTMQIEKGVRRVFLQLPDCRNIYGDWTAGNLQAKHRDVLEYVGLRFSYPSIVLLQKLLPQPNWRPLNHLLQLIDEMDADAMLTPAACEFALLMLDRDCSETPRGGAV